MLEEKELYIVLTLEKKVRVVFLILEERRRVFRTIGNRLQTEATK